MYFGPGEAQILLTRIEWIFAGIVHREMITSGVKWRAVSQKYIYVSG